MNTFYKPLLLFQPRIETSKGKKESLGCSKVHYSYCMLPLPCGSLLKGEAWWGPLETSLNTHVRISGEPYPA